MRARLAVLTCIVLAVGAVARAAEPAGPQFALPQGWTTEERAVRVATPAGDRMVRITYYLPPADQALTDGHREMEFVLVRPGEFLMSSPARERGRHPGEPEQHPARVERAFLLSTCEITQQQYYAVLSGEGEPVEPDVAKEGVNRWDAERFCDALSERQAVAYRLPTEVEWEYACRAGSTTPYYWGRRLRDDCAWHKDNSGMRARPVGQKLPNAWGLHDMAGNVWEWCSGPSRGGLRGGSWGGGPYGLRSARRFARLKGHNDYHGCGFRVVVDIVPAPDEDD